VQISYDTGLRHVTALDIGVINLKSNPRVYAARVAKFEHFRNPVISGASDLHPGEKPARNPSVGKTKQSVQLPTVVMERSCVMIYVGAC